MPWGCGVKLGLADPSGVHTHHRAAACGLALGASRLEPGRRAVRLALSDCVLHLDAHRSGPLVDRAQTLGKQSLIIRPH